MASAGHGSELVGKAEDACLMVDTINFSAADINIPSALTVFPGEIYRAPRSWAERSYHKLNHRHAVDKDGHFATWEQPELFAEVIQAAFRSLR